MNTTLFRAYLKVHGPSGQIYGVRVTPYTEPVQTADEHFELFDISEEYNDPDYVTPDQKQEYYDAGSGTLGVRSEIVLSTSGTIAISDDSDTIEVVCDQPIDGFLAVGGQEIFVVSGGVAKVKFRRPGREKLELLGKYTGQCFVDCVTSLEELKDLASKITTRNKKFESELPILWGADHLGRNYSWDADPASQQAVLGVVSGIQVGMTLDSDFTWTSADNIDVPMDADAMRGLAAALLNNVSRIHRKNRNQKITIQDCNSPDDVRSIITELPQKW